MKGGGRSRPDRGSLSVYIAVLAVPFLLVAGLVVDGSGALVAKQRAFDEAGQAARAGANQLDLAVLRGPGGKRVVDDAAAKAAVDAYFSRGSKSTLHTTTVGHNPEQVTVYVTVTYAPVVLTGIQRSFTEHATAVPLSK